MKKHKEHKKKRTDKQKLKERQAKDKEKDAQLKKNIIKESFTLTGASRYRSFVLFVLSCLGFEFHGKAGSRTKYIIYGGEHNVDAKVEDHYNFKKGPGQVRISMLDLDLSKGSPF